MNHDQLLAARRFLVEEQMGQHIRRGIQQTADDEAAIANATADDLRKRGLVEE